MKMRPYFYKLIVILLLVSVPPFLAASFYTISAFAEQSARLVNEKNAAELSRTGFLLEKTLKQIKEVAISGINNELLTPDSVFSPKSSADRFRMMEKIGTIRFNNEYMDSVYFYDAEEDYLLISNFGAVRNVQENGYGWVQDEVSRIANILEVTVTGTRVVKTSENDHYLVSLIVKLPIPFNSHNYLIFNVDVGKIYRNFVEQLNVNSAIYSYFILDANGKIIFHNDPMQISGSVGDEIKGNFQQNGMILDTSRKVVNSYRLDSLDWYLIGEVNVSQLYGKINALKSKMYVILSSFVAIILCLVVAGSRQLYKPVRTVTSKLKSRMDAEPQPINGDFDYISTSLDRIMEKNTLLEAHLVTKEEQLIRTSVYNLIKHRYASKADHDHYLQKYRTNLVVAVFRQTPGGAEDTADFSFVRYFEQHVASVFQSDLFQDSEQEFVALFRLPHGDINRFIVDLLLQFDASQQLLEQWSISIGQIYSDIAQVHHSYTEAKYAYNMGQIDEGQSRIYCYNKLPADYNGGNKDEAIMDQLELAILQQNEKSFLDLLNRLFRGDLSIMQYHLNLYSAISLLIRLYDRESVAILKEINELLTGNGIMNTTLIKNFFYGKFGDFAGSRRDTGETGNGYIEKIEAYIVSRYHTNFSLDELADHVGLSKQYICSIIKQHYQTTFVDFVNQHRIEQAKRMLEDSDMKISGVYSQVGFSSNSYFTKVFKLYSGITPSEYRELSLSRRKYGGA